MKHFIKPLIIFLVCAVSNLYGQYGPYGINFDQDGTMIYNYIDKEYAPKTFFEVTHKSTKGLPGSYISHKGNQFYGYIKDLDYNSISFKEEGKPTYVSLGVSKIQTVYYANKKYTVITDFPLENALGKLTIKAGLAEEVTIINDTAYYEYTSGTESQGKPQKFYFFKVPGDSIVYPIHKNSNKFREQCAEMFGKAEFLLPYINKKTTKFEEFPSILKAYEYHLKKSTQEPTLLNAMMEEVLHDSTARYCYTVDTVGVDWQLSYFTYPEKVLVSKASYELTQPFKRTGSNSYYDADGKLRSYYKYDDKGNVNKIVNCYPTGGTMSIVNIVKEKPYFGGIYDQEKNNLFKAGASSHTISDNNKNIVLGLSKNDISSAHFTDESGKAIFLKAPIPAKMNGFKSVKSKFSSQIKYTDELLINNYWGTLLLKVRIGSDGKVLAQEVANAPDPATAKSILDFFNDPENKISWTAGKHDNKNVECETVVPIKYGIVGNSLNPYRGYHYMMFHHQWMMNPMYFNNYNPGMYMPNITVPSGMATPGF